MWINKLQLNNMILESVRVCLEERNLLTYTRIACYSFCTFSLTSVVYSSPHPFLWLPARNMPWRCYFNPGHLLTWQECQERVGVTSRCWLSAGTRIVCGIGWHSRTHGLHGIDALQVRTPVFSSSVMLKETCLFCIFVFFYVIPCIGRDLVDFER